MLNVRQATETLTILSKECRNGMYVTCNIFLKCIEAKYVSEIKKNVKLKEKKNASCLATYK